MLAVATLATVAGGFAYAQRYGGGPSAVPYCYAPEECPQTPYDGRFTFVRMFFETHDPRGGFGRFGGRGGEPPWHHDRPEAEWNLSAILREISTVRTFDGITGGNVFALDDEEIFRYPVVWVSEPGYWVPTDDQVKSLRAYLLKGGFMIFDDFDFGHFDNLLFQLNRAFPELRPVQLTGTEPIWQSFFDVKLNELRLSNAGYGQQTYWGLFEENDPTKRQLAIMNVNNDIGELMEHSATGFMPVDMSNDAYKLAVNYIMYALTH